MRCVHKPFRHVEKRSKNYGLLATVFKSLSGPRQQVKMQFCIHHTSLISIFFYFFISVVITRERWRDSTRHAIFLSRHYDRP